MQPGAHERQDRGRCVGQVWRERAARHPRDSSTGKIVSMGKGHQSAAKAPGTGQLTMADANGLLDREALRMSGSGFVVRLRGGKIR
jgi:hypothetical protein